MMNQSPPPTSDPGDAGADVTGANQQAGATTPPPPAAPQRWRLMRSDEGKIGGVCQGLADSAGLDPTVVRAGCILSMLAGIGILVYVVLWVIAPTNVELGLAHVPESPERERTWMRRALLALLIVSFVNVFVAHNIFSLPGGGWVGLALIALGGWLLYRRDVHRSVDDTGAPGRGVSSPVVSPTAPAAATGWAAPSGAPHTAAVAGLGGPAGFPGSTTSADGGRTREPRSLGMILARLLGWLTVFGSVPFALAFIGFHALGVFTVPLMWLWLVVLVAAIIYVGWRSAVAKSPGTILAGVVAVFVISVGYLAATGSVAGRMGNFNTVAPRGSESVVTKRLSIGVQTIDLTGITEEDSPYTVEARVGLGVIELVVPDDAAVTITGKLRGGEITTPAESSDRFMEDFVTTLEGDGPRIAAKVDIGVGELRVCRESQMVTASKGNSCSPMSSLSGGINVDVKP